MVHKYAAQVKTLVETHYMMKKRKNLIEDKGKTRLRSPTLFGTPNVVVLNCGCICLIFLWTLALQLWSASEAVTGVDSGGSLGSKDPFRIVKWCLLHSEQ